MSTSIKIIEVGNNALNHPLLKSEAYEELFSLQLEQFDHDKKYHSDIHILPVHQRMNHMALHFAKYAGRLAEITGSADVKEKYSQTIVDIFVIALSSSNILNINLLEELKKADSFSVECKNEDAVFRSMTILSGRLAKACESLDHVEKFPYKEAMQESVIRICALAILAAQNGKFDLVKSTRERLATVKKRNLFYSVLSRT